MPRSWPRRSHHWNNRASSLPGIRQHTSFSTRSRRRLRCRPHPNACLTCPDFQTTPTFLPIHRRQRDDTLELIELAEHRGNTRLADNHRQVLANLDAVITALATIDEGDSP